MKIMKLINSNIQFINNNNVFVKISCNGSRNSYNSNSNNNINGNDNNNSIGNTNNNKKSNNICIFLFKLVIKSFSFNEINVLFMKNKSLQNKLFLVLMNGRDLIKFR